MQEKVKTVPFLKDDSKIVLLDAYRNAQSRLLLLDYDGTLVPFASSPELAVPDEHLLQLLNHLGSINGNEVFLISGRSSSWLDKYFGMLPVHLIAEHGAKVRHNSVEWQTQISTNVEWKSDVYSVMKIFEQDCANSFIEEKEFSIVWHYRQVESPDADLKARQLVEELKKTLQNQNLEVLPGNKIVEVRMHGINKGVSIKKILSRKTYDFILAVGDDNTDEDMFRALVGSKNCFTVKVGVNESFAQYSLSQPQVVVSLLEDMQSL